MQEYFRFQISKTNLIKGFDAKDQKITDDLKAGIGILGMNERVEIVGGKFDIQSRKGYGTRISVEIPLYQRGV